MWLPYYFQKRGFEQEAAFISLTIPVVIPIGAVLLSILLKKIPEKQNLCINIFLIIQVLAFVLLVIFSTQI